MKRIALLLFFIMHVGIACWGQLRQSKRWDFSAYLLPEKTGITNSISTKIKPETYRNQPTFSGGGGIAFTYWTNRRMGFQGGLLVTSHNQKFTSDLLSYIVKGKKRLHYLEVPLMIVFNNHIYKRLSSTVFFGPQISYLLKGAGAIVLFKHNDDGSYTFYDLPPSGSQYYTRLLYEVAGGMGFNVILTPQLSFTIAGRVDYSLNDLENKKATSYGHIPTYTYGDPNRKVAHKYSVGLQMGINYTINGDHLLLPSKRYY